MGIIVRVRLLPLIALLAWGLAAFPAPAQQPGALPPQEPMLRIDPGMHTAPIMRIGVDAACSLLATGSQDKTVRLWRLPEGRLLRTLRPPIGPGIDGEILAVAMAPDGSWVAAGGRDAAWKAQGGHFLNVFDVATGALAARLGPPGDVITHLAVSLDGRYLAATLRERGLRVWERTGTAPVTWRLVAEDRDYGGQRALHAAFDHAGTLYTVAFDGKLRRYAPGFQDRPGAVATRGGARPISVAVHPWGDKVAVGFQDTAAVDVYDAAALAWRFAPDTTSATNGILNSVAWSADGARLYAGRGRFSKPGGTFPILVWDRAGQGKGRELDGPMDTIVHLLPCGSNIAMGSMAPGFGLLAPDGSRLTWQGAVQPDLRGQRSNRDFAVTGDARRVRFGLEALGDLPVLFDLGAEQLEDAPDVPGNMTGPDTTSLPITSWTNDPAPKLDGAPLELARFERSRSLAITPDKQSFVLGAEWYLRRYDRTGQVLWRKYAPSVAWAVNIAKDGRVVLAGYGDGTVRWHRLSDGEELLALFVHKGDKRWVAWTPKGYYMASPGAGSLIGWHLNRDWDEAARFYPINRFRAQFNRPDIVKLVLETLDEGKAVEEANRRARVTRGEEDVRKLGLPPIVTIEEPGDNASFRAREVIIKYNVYSATGREITNTAFFINNVALDGARLAAERTPGVTTSYKIMLPMPPRDVIVKIVAYEGNTPSEPATLRLRWEGPAPGKEHLKPLRALFVGVNAYAHLPKLEFANKDAADLAKLFKSHEGRSYSKVEAKVLPNAVRADVLEGLEWLGNGSQAGDVNLLFLAGHGYTDARQKFYFMTADSVLDSKTLHDTAVSQDRIVDAIGRLKGIRIVMIDACRSGTATGVAGLAAALGPVDMHRAAEELGDETLGVLLYTSAKGRQISWEHPDWQNGAFTKAMQEGLRGGADLFKRGYVEAGNLGSYVRERVKDLTEKNGGQEPVRRGGDDAMKIVLLK